MLLLDLYIYGIFVSLAVVLTENFATNKAKQYAARLAIENVDSVSITRNECATLGAFGHIGYIYLFLDLIFFVFQV